MAKFDDVEECRHSHRDVRSGNWFYLLEDNLVISVKTLNEHTVYIKAVHSQEVFSIDMLADVLPALFVKEKQNKTKLDTA